MIYWMLLFVALSSSCEKECPQPPVPGGCGTEGNYFIWDTKVPVRPDSGGFGNTPLVTDKYFFCSDDEILGNDPAIIYKLDRSNGKILGVWRGMLYQKDENFPDGTWYYSKATDRLVVISRKNAYIIGADLKTLSVFSYPEYCPNYSSMLGNEFFFPTETSGKATLMMGNVSSGVFTELASFGLDSLGSRPRLYALASRVNSKGETVVFFKKHSYKFLGSQGGFNRLTLYAWNATTGKKEWELPDFDGNPFRSTQDPMQFCNGNLIVQGFSALYAINPVNGAIVWRVDNPVKQGNGDPALFSIRGYTVLGDRIFAQTSTQNFMCFNQHGKLLYRRDNFGSGDDYLSAQAGKIMVSSGGTVYALDPNDGKTLWRYNGHPGAYFVGHIVVDPLDESKFFAADGEYFSYVCMPKE